MGSIPMFTRLTVSKALTFRNLSPTLFRQGCRLGILERIWLASCQPSHWYALPQHCSTLLIASCNMWSLRWVRRKLLDVSPSIITPAHPFDLSSEALVLSRKRTMDLSSGSLEAMQIRVNLPHGSEETW